jgi:hypothetical protein
VEEENSVTTNALAEVEGGRRMSKTQQVNALRAPGAKQRLKYAARARKRQRKREEVAAQQSTQAGIAQLNQINARGVNRVMTHANSLQEAVKTGNDRVVEHALKRMAKEVPKVVRDGKHHAKQVTIRAKRGETKKAKAAKEKDRQQAQSEEARRAARRKAEDRRKQQQQEKRQRNARTQQEQQQQRQEQQQQQQQQQAVVVGEGTGERSEVTIPRRFFEPPDRAASSVGRAICDGDKASMMRAAGDDAGVLAMDTWPTEANDGSVSGRDGGEQLTEGAALTAATVAEREGGSSQAPPTLQQHRQHLEHLRSQQAQQVKTREEHARQRAAAPWVQQGQGRRQQQQHGQRPPMAHRHEHRQGTQAAGTVHCERCNVRVAANIWNEHCGGAKHQQHTGRKQGARGGDVTRFERKRQRMAGNGQRSKKKRRFKITAQLNR